MDEPPMSDSHKRRYGYIPPEKKRKNRFDQEKVDSAFDRKKHQKRRARTEKKTSKSSTFSWNIWKKRLLIIALGLFAFGFLASTIAVAWVSRDLADIEQFDDQVIHQSTKIYDRSGEELLYEIFADEKRTVVELEDIPDNLINGLIATEDSKFYEHRGIRPLAIIRSVVYGLLGRGRIGGGASTLTQQLVKNAILTSERTVTRKLKEAILTIRLEQKYTKDQILTFYFNEIPYGSTNYGIEAAAQNYFGKSVRDLDLQESATLAGLPKQPSYYLANPEALKVRRDFVLRRMFEEGYISEEEKNSAQAMDLTLERRVSDIRAPHFVLDVKRQLVEEFGEKRVDTGGLKVITTLDWKMQESAEEIITKAKEEQFETAGANNAALLSMDPKTGEILTMVGSADFFDRDIDGQFNVAVDGRRQPGSSFKPIVYTAAFEEGYTPETVLFDVLTNFAVSGEPYEPKNYDLLERGPVTIRQALQGSLNIPAVKALYLVGEDAGIDFAKRLGYSTFGEGDFGLSLVLGGGEVSMVEHVGAYAVFANQGERQEPTSILRVEGPDGEILMEHRSERGEKVLERDVANTIANVLSDNDARAYAFGRNNQLVLPGRQAAAKTGTTNGYVDAWTVGFTPGLVTGVWAGNTDNSPMNRGYGGSRVAAPIWNEFMRTVLEDTPAENFPTAPANDATKPVLRGSEGGNITLKVNKVTGKRVSSSTPEHLIVERTYIQPHSILHYVIKDNPRGDAPKDPAAADPQYTVWEAAIQSWIERRREQEPDWDVSFEEPPVEYDDEYSLELIPELTVNSPVRSSTLRSRQIQTDIDVRAPRGVTSVTYQIDGVYVDVIREAPFNLDYNAVSLSAGNHILTITVEDDIGNRLTEDIPFTLDVLEVRPMVLWIERDRTIKQSLFPAAFFLDPIQKEQFESLTVMASNDDGDTTEVFYTENFDTLINERILVEWTTAPDVGKWALSTQLVLKNGDVLIGNDFTVTITE